MRWVVAYQSHALVIPNARGLLLAWGTRTADKLLIAITNSDPAIVCGFDVAESQTGIDGGTDGFVTWEAGIFHNLGPLERRRWAIDLDGQQFCALYGSTYGGGSINGLITVLLGYTL